MVMNREDIYRIFGDKDVSYVFNRVKIDTDKQKARDIITVRGSLLEEDLGLSNMDGLMLEMLIGDQFIEFYQHIINLKYDNRPPEEKLYMFSSHLYKWVSQRLGYIPDWVLPNREQHLTMILNLLLVEADDYIPDSEVLLAILLRNTDFSNSKLFKEQLRLGVWSSTETGNSSIDVAEDEYLMGRTNTSVDSLSLYVRIAERGYRDVDTFNTYIEDRSFKNTVVTDYDEVCKALNEFMWQYANGERWVGFTEEFYTYATRVPFNKVSVERPNPNQVVFRDKEEEFTTVQFTFSDKVEVTVRRGTKIEVAYNKEFYYSNYEYISQQIAKYTYRAKNVIPIVQTILRNIPIQIPNKEREIKQYNK